MRPYARFDVNGLTVLINDSCKRRGPIGRQTGLHKQFRAAAIRDRVLALDGVPKFHARFPEFSGRIWGCRLPDDRFLGVLVHEKSPPNVSLIIPKRDRHRARRRAALLFFIPPPRGGSPSAPMPYYKLAIAGQEVA